MVTLFYTNMWKEKQENHKFIEHSTTTYAVTYNIYTNKTSTYSIFKYSKRLSLNTEMFYIIHSLILSLAHSSFVLVVIIQPIPEANSFRFRIALDGELARDVEVRHVITVIHRRPFEV